MIFDAWFSKNQARIERSLAELINIQTVTPEEHRAFEFATRYFEGLGFSVIFEPAHPKLHEHPSFSPHRFSRIATQNGNLRARLTKPWRKKKVLFNCHLDVVPGSENFPQAFDCRVQDGMIIGRGACDTKNNLIMLGEAVRFMLESGIPMQRAPQIDMVVEEEIGGNGTLSTILHGTDAEEVICLEPTGLMVYRGHRGCVSFEIEVPGRPVHMGSHSKGTNAIEWTYETIKLLKQLERKLLSEARRDRDFNKWKRPLQLNIGIISGGQWSGSVPERCTLWGDMGFLPNYSIEEIKDLIRRTCSSVRHKWVADNIKVNFNGLCNDAYIMDPKAQLVKDLISAGARNGPAQITSHGWNVSCDARHYNKILGLPVVIFGSGQLSMAHSAHECVEMAELKRGCRIIADFLGSSPSDA